MAIALLQRPESNYREAKFLTIKINSSDFERQDAAIREHILYPDEVVVAVDHSGGHYSEPLVYFLQGKHYNVCYLEPKPVKGAKEMNINLSQSWMIGDGLIDIKAGKDAGTGIILPDR